jgi:hypothetical protein
MGLTTLLAVGAIWLGNAWWKNVDQDYLSRILYQPSELATRFKDLPDGGQKLVISLAHTREMDPTALVPDHGYLMHLFMVRQPNGDAFAHLHPLRDTEEGATSLSVLLPGMPAGDYAIYADITQDSGFTQTLTNAVRLEDKAAPNSGAAGSTNSDDVIHLAAPGTPAERQLEGGYRVRPSIPAELRAGQETTLAFDVSTPDGAVAALEPYLGMYGHLMIEHEDGSVFSHMHPLGSISMTAQRRFAERDHAGYLANQPLDVLCAPPSQKLSFPFSFPKPGAYRLWLQIKLSGKVRTEAYLVKVR